jgi:RHS repeat-associated protein
MLAESSFGGQVSCLLGQNTKYKKQEIATKNDHRYFGKELDRETGLIYMGARYLDPATGRFNRPDPVQLVDPFTGKINQQMLLNPQRQNR